MGTAHTSSIAEKLLGKAEVKLSAARELFESGFFEDSASRSYYAMFHAARAALTKVGVTTKTHEGTVSEFGRRLVLEGAFPRDLGRALAEAKAARETYEYSATMEIERDEAEALLRDAEKFVAQVKSKLKSLKPLSADTEGTKTRLSDPVLVRRPRGKSGLGDLSRKHDDYLYGKKSRVSS